MLPQLKIAFDAKRVYNNPTGLGNYGRMLIGALQDLQAIKLYAFTPKIKLQVTYKHVVLVEPTHTISKIFKGIWRMVAPSFYCKQNNIQLYHGLSNELPFFTKRNKLKTIVTIHDLIFLRYPAYYPFFDRLLYYFKSKYACKTANHIVAISEQTKRDIVSYYKIPNNKISVIPLAVDGVFLQHHSSDFLMKVKQKYQLIKPYFITVGTVENRKNQLNIIKALKQLYNREIELIIVGKHSSNYAKTVKDFIHNHALAARFLKVDNTNELAALYKQSLALIYVSEFEGFGIPPLEAMACGTAIIASNTSSIPEVCGNAALYVNPYNTSEIKDAMLQIIEDADLVNNLIKQGNKQIELFNINAIASKYLQLYNKVVAEIK
jgi:glycosyltransferase involved in cell wall biosynthesis